MDDPEIILYLFTAPGAHHIFSQEMITHPENESRFLPGEGSHRPIADDETLDIGDFLKTVDRLVIRFSHVPQTTLGIMAGCGPQVDLALPTRRGVSQQHFVFTFDDNNSPIVKDYSSRTGIKVTYVGEQREYLTGATWALIGPEDAVAPPTLYVTDRIQFMVFFPGRDMKSADYVNRANLFRQGKSGSHGALPALRSESGPSTQLPTNQRTPSCMSRPVILQTQIGQGSTAKVFRLWDVATPDTCISKVPMPRLPGVAEITWRNKVAIMSRIKHEHIIAFRYAEMIPVPYMILDYAAGGSLEALPDRVLTHRQATQVLSQLCSALKYLHVDLDPPVVHREIKPSRILIAARTDHDIHVKFADFGRVQVDYVNTSIGASRFIAPDVFDCNNREPFRDARYESRIDIWSLGVVVASLTSGLPAPSVYDSAWRLTPWLKVLDYSVQQHQSRPNLVLRFVLEYMLLVNPIARMGARFCNDRALILLEHMRTGNYR